MLAGWARPALLHRARVVPLECLLHNLRGGLPRRSCSRDGLFVGRARWLARFRDVREFGVDLALLLPADGRCATPRAALIAQADLALAGDIRALLVADALSDDAVLDTGR